MSKPDEAYSQLFTEWSNPARPKTDTVTTANDWLIPNNEMTPFYTKAGTVVIKPIFMNLKHVFHVTGFIL